MSKLGKDPMLQELGASLKPCPICQQSKPCPCEDARKTIGRPDLILHLKRVLQHEYDQGYNTTCDAIEDAITELERLSDIAQSLHREISHVRAINQRMVETLIEIAPLKQFVWTLDSSRSSANRRNGGDSGSDAKPPKSEVTQEWPRANPDELKLFDEATKECTMNCGPHVNDPRTARERKFLCEDCINKEKKCK